MIILLISLPLFERMGSVAEDPVFGFRAAAPGLLCNESYRKNEFIGWDPKKMKTV